jgi:hypothetical protein
MNRRQRPWISCWNRFAVVSSGLTDGKVLHLGKINDSRQVVPAE